MNQLLTNKIWCVLLRGGAEIWITEEQANELDILIQVPERRFIKINNERVAITAIDGILSAEIMRTKERTKRGDWQCSSNYWHEKGQQCGHGL